MSRSGFWPWPRALAILSACAMVSVLCVRIGIADAMVARDPAAALRWWPAQSEAASRRLQSLLASDDSDGADPDEARRLATAMLRHSPLSGTAYAGLARLSDAAGEPARAMALMSAAVERSPRERLTHAWLADQYVAREDFVRAMRHFDQMLRLSPRQAHTLMPSLVSLAQHPKGMSVVAAWLGELSPPWRDRFLGSWASKATSEAMLDGVFDPLRRAKHPLTSTERSLWVGRLVQQGRVSKAHYLWIDGLPEAQRLHVGNVFDGGFELPPSQGGFGWRFGQVPGAIIRQQPGAGVEGQQALVVEFRHRRVAFQHVQQTLALPAGSYRLLGRVRLDDLRNDRGLKWVLLCTSRNRQLTETRKFNGRSEWVEFSTAFDVPEEGCPAQLLRLQIDARVPAEQWIGGRAWFDGLRILRVNEPRHVESGQARG